VIEFHYSWQLNTSKHRWQKFHSGMCNINYTVSKMANVEIFKIFYSCMSNPNPNPIFGRAAIMLGIGPHSSVK